MGEYQPHIRDENRALYYLLNDTLFPEAGKAVVKVLERLGHEVSFPEEQTCCGQMFGNSGYAAEGEALAKRFQRVFANEEVIVSPSASCVAYLREQELDLDGRLYEFSELLIDVLGVEDVGAVFPHRVTYHPTCHSLRLLEIGDKPLRLLRTVRGLELVDLPEANECCGFGGTFAIKNADTSAAILDDKVANIRASGAEVCVAADNSCLMQIGGALQHDKSTIRTLHLAEVLACT